jgi:nucleosome binding factor SPN SPT16 subunit
LYQYGADFHDQPVEGQLFPRFFSLPAKQSPQKQESQYTTLLDARNEALKLLKEGAVTKDVYAQIQSFVAGKSGTLADAFSKNIGFAVCLLRSRRTASPDDRRLVSSIEITVSCLGRRMVKR